MKMVSNATRIFALSLGWIYGCSEAIIASINLYLFQIYILLKSGIDSGFQVAGAAISLVSLIKVISRTLELEGSFSLMTNI